MAVEFFTLGAVRVSVDGTDVRIRGRRERSVLSVLLAARRHVVSAERLMQDVWGDDVTGSTPGSLQVAVSRLRAIVEPGRVRGAEPTLLVTSAPGYALLAPPTTVDVERYTRLVEGADAALAADDPEAALEKLEESARLWRGTPFAESVDGELIRSETARLEDLRLRSHELRGQALLALGRHGLATGELEALVVGHPLRERLWELLALAQYRAGRQGDALATLRRARAVLADELGVDPSPALRDLEADVLAQSPALDAPAPREKPTTGDPVAAGTTTRDRPTFVGRTAALTGLTDELEGVLAGHGRTVLVSGHAGVGKTRLVTELAATAADRGVRVLWGRCHEADFSPAYWPWLPVLRELGPGRPGSPVAALLSASEAAPDAGAGAAELRTHDAVSLLLAERAADGPLLLVVEDVQWADASSLRLLTYVAETLGSARVMVLSTLRDVAGTTPELEAFLGAIGRMQARRVPLAGLAAVDVRGLVGVLSGTEPDDELTSVLAERTDGNPFFVIELVRLLEARHRLHGAGARQVPVPHGVQDVLRLRLATLTDTAGRLLRVAAVIGREFDLDVVCEVSGTDVDEAIDVLDEAVRTHHVEDHGTPGRYRFTHALVRETLRDGQSLARRGQVHAAVAVALETRLRDDPELVTAVAHHFVLGAAIRPELGERAVRYAIAAARLAERRGALDEALTHWEQAQTAETATPDPHRRYDVLLGLGRARQRRAEVAGSRRALEAAVALGHELGDLELVAEAATSFRGAGVWRWRELGDDDPSLVAVLRDAAARLAPGALLARVLASLSMELTTRWSSAEADSVSSAAVEMARRVEDVDLFADVVAMRMLVLWGRPGAAPERLALAAEVLRRPLSLEQELYARFAAAPAHLQLGDTDAADREITRCTELARRMRHTGADVPLMWWHLCRAVATGDTEAVGRLTHHVIDLHRRSQTVALPEAASMARLRGEGPGAPVPDAAVALAVDNANPAYRALVAHALTEVGRCADAVELLGDPVPDRAWNYSSTYGDCLRVDVLATAGPGPRLRQALDRIEPWGHEFAVYGSTDYLGSVEYFVGRGREGLGDLDGARSSYGRAVERNRAAGVLPWLRRAEQRLVALPARG